MIQKPVPQQVMQRKFDLKVDTKPITSLNDSDEFVKDFFAKKENSFYESSISTTHSDSNGLNTSNITRCKGKSRSEP